MPFILELLYPPNILFIVARLDPGGLENYLIRFLKYCGPRIRPVVLCKTGQMGQLSSLFANEGIRVESHKMGYFNFRAWIWFSRFLKSEKITSVCDFTGDFAGIYLMLAYKLKIPRRIVFYRQARNHFRESLVKTIYSGIVRQLTRIYASNLLFNSNAGMDFFFPKRTKRDLRFNVLKNGVDFRHFRNDSTQRDALRQQLDIPQNAIVISHTGRFDPAKNHSLILKVAEFITGKNSNVYFVLAGKSTDDLKEVITHSMQKQVRLLGHREDVQVILSASDIFFFPSLTEGQPNSLIEAMMADLPIIASNIESIKEMVPGEFIGKLIDPTDVHKFCDVLNLLVNSEEIRQSYRLKDFACSQFDSEKLFNDFLMVLISGLPSPVTAL